MIQINEQNAVELLTSSRTATKLPYIWNLEQVEITNQQQKKLTEVASDIKHNDLHNRTDMK